MRYRAEGKPIVVSMGNIAASGGYYIAGWPYTPCKFTALMCIWKLLAGRQQA